MNSGKKFLGVVLALAVVTALGCSRNKPQPVPAYGTGVAPAGQPMVNASAPAPTTSHSSNYIK